VKGISALEPHSVHLRRGFVFYIRKFLRKQVATLARTPNSYPKFMLEACDCEGIYGTLEELNLAFIQSASWSVILAIALPFGSLICGRNLRK